jgi:hypothetical protein
MFNGWMRHLLFIDAANNNYLASNVVESMSVCDKIERNVEKATAVYFKVLFKNVTVGTEETTQTLVNRDVSVFQPGYDPNTFRIQVRISTVQSVCE